MKHLITDDEAIAMLEAVGASKETVRRFSMQIGAVLARKPALGPIDGATCYSIAGAKTKEPGVNIDFTRMTEVGNAVCGVGIEMGSIRVQFDVKSAMAHAHNIIGCCEAAISDVAVFRLLTDRLGLEPERAGRVLIDLREIRQGSRGAVVAQ